MTPYIPLKALHWLLLALKINPILSIGCSDLLGSSLQVLKYGNSIHFLTMTTLSYLQVRFRIVFSVLQTILFLRSKCQNGTTGNHGQLPKRLTVGFIRKHDGRHYAKFFMCIIISNTYTNKHCYFTQLLVLPFPIWSMRIAPPGVVQCSVLRMTFCSRYY